MDLPEPQCKLGYPYSQLREILSQEKFFELSRWMHGQPTVMCSGWVTDYDTNEKVKDTCGPHGEVVYRKDVIRFVRGISVKG